MDKKNLSKKQKMLARIHEFTLMDDDFMTRFFENDKECTQFVLQTILGNKKLKVIDVLAQKAVKSLEGRSVRLDVFARDGRGKPYDIEIQRADKGAGAKRARYNSALMDADETVPGTDASKLPESYVIFTLSFFSAGKVNATRQLSPAAASVPVFSVAPLLPMPGIMLLLPPPSVSEM